MNSASSLAAPSQRVLVVDPDPETRALYERSFLMAGFEVMHAADGREALTKALVHPPNLVVMELRLPLINGFALCEILRRDNATTGALILVVTAETRPVELEGIRRVGADDVMAKPVPPDALVHRAGQLMAASDDAGRNAVPVSRRSGLGLSNAPKSFSQMERGRRTARTHMRRELTATPPLRAPALTCPSCDRALAYHFSQTGGVSERHSEQWDYFSCPACGAFQYRQRTRRLRRLDDSEEQWLQGQRVTGGSAAP
jgi:DNA-binding response OmpR family regulator